MLPHADTAGTTRAFIGQGADVESASVDIDADGAYSATATTVATDSPPPRVTAKVTLTPETGLRV